MAQFCGVSATTLSAEREGSYMALLMPACHLIIEVSFGGSFVPFHPPPCYGTTK